MMNAENEEVKQKTPCPEFPFFGASYPDATCIDGWLWDLDKFEDGQLVGGGEEPCPFCNAEAILEMVDEEDKEEVKSNIEALRKKYS